MRPSVALAVASILPFAVACSSYADTSAKQVEKDVKTAMADVTSVHLTGDVLREGTRLDMDLSINTEGDCEGSIGLGSVGRFDILRVDGKSYVKPDAAFWKASGAGGIADKVNGRWVVGGNSFADLTEACDLVALLASFTSAEDKYSKVSGTDTEVDGQEVVKVAFTTSGGAEGNLFVSADKPHHVVKAVVGKDATLTFTDINEPVEPKAPAKGQVVDAATLR